MPLLSCPNCQSNMQALNRSGVEFDMCPTCRGVWLDRGELEKIIQDARAGAEPASQAAPPPRRDDGYGRDGYAQRSSQEYGERGEYGEHGEYGERGEHGGRHDPRRKRRGFDLFDIFD